MFKLTILHVASVFAVVIAVSAECKPDKSNGRAYHYEVIKYIDGNRRINELSLVGSHHSVSYVTEDKTEKTQEWTIYEQLESGVRVLHFNVKPDSNDLSIYLEKKKLKLKFNADILPIINKFLDSYSNEFIVVYFNQEDANAGSNCGILNQIKNSSSGHRINTKWTVDDLIRTYRGYILIAGDKSFKGCANNLQSECATDEYNPANNVDDVIYKWKAIKKLQDFISLRNFDCYIQQLYLPNNLKSDLSLISKTGGYKTSDGECAQPLNMQMAKYFRGSPLGFTIIMANFVTQKLIDKINDSNALTAKINQSFKAAVLF